MPGDYTSEELQTMPREEFEAAVARGFIRATPATTPPPVPSADVWRTAKEAGKSRTRDFTCPSGQTCRIRPLDPERLLEHGILDKITRLEGLADGLVQTAEGQPPVLGKVPTREELELLLDTVNIIVPLAVEEPYLSPVPEKGTARNPELIYVDDVDVDDRMAILEEALKGLKQLDRFRHP
jgi:hypothetical protein